MSYATVEIDLDDIDTDTLIRHLTRQGYTITKGGKSATDDHEHDNGFAQSVGGSVAVSMTSSLKDAYLAEAVENAAFRLGINRLTDKINSL